RHGTAGERERDLTVHFFHRARAGAVPALPDGRDLTVVEVVAQRSGWTKRRHVRVGAVEVVEPGHARLALTARIELHAQRGRVEVERLLVQHGPALPVRRCLPQDDTLLLADAQVAVGLGVVGNGRALALA